MNPFDTSFVSSIGRVKCPESTYMIPTIALMIVGFMMLYANIECAMLEHPSYVPVEYNTFGESIKDYKTPQMPSNGTVRLIKGTVTVPHHNIKNDSTIIVSRKNVEGKLGTHLVVSITPNIEFKIDSISDTGELETLDYGEICFMIL